MCLREALKCKYAALPLSSPQSSTHNKCVTECRARRLLFPPASGCSSQIGRVRPEDGTEGRMDRRTWTSNLEGFDSNCLMAPTTVNFKCEKRILMCLSCSSESIFRKADQPLSLSLSFSLTSRLDGERGTQHSSEQSQDARRHFSRFDLKI